MSKAYPDLHGADWRTLFRTAILETNKAGLHERLSEAEGAVLKRGREIFYEHASLEEQRALEDALFVLLALRTAWQHTEGGRCAPIRFSVPVLPEAFFKHSDPA